MPTQRSLFSRIIGRSTPGPVVYTRADAPAPIGLGPSAGGTGNLITQFLGAARQALGAKRNANQFLESYKELPWQRAAVSKIASSVSHVDWIALIEDPETEQLVTLQDLLGFKHPIEEFFDNPHPYFSWQTIVYLWTIWLKSNGEAFGIWDDNPHGRQIWPVKPETIVKLPTPEEPYFILSLSTGQHQVPYNEILWLIDPDPSAPYSRGTGAAEALDDELSIDEAAAKTMRGFFENQARPDILITGKGLNPEKTKKIEEEWKEKQSGFWNVYKPHFMSEQVEIREFKQDFQSMQFIELRKYERDTITQELGVPPEIMNIVENSNRATIDAAVDIFMRFTIDPILRQMREAFQKQLVPKFDSLGRIELDYESPIPEDKEYNLRVAQAAPYAFMIDEVRAMAEQDPLPNGVGEKFPKPLNLDFISVNDEEVAEEEEPVPDGLEPAGEETQLMPVAPPASTSFKPNKGRKIRTGRGFIIRTKRRR